MIFDADFILKKGEEVPVEMIKAQKLIRIFVVLFSFMIWLFMICKKDVMDILFVGYGVLASVIVMRYHYKANSIVFYSRFKRLNIYNCRYLFLGFKRLPQKAKIGNSKCDKANVYFLYEIKKVYYII